MTLVGSAVIVRVYQATTGRRIEVAAVGPAFTSVAVGSEVLLSEDLTSVRALDVTKFPTLVPSHAAYLSDASTYYLISGDCILATGA